MTCASYPLFYRAPLLFFRALLFFFLAALPAALAGCGIYQNQGRKSFEARSGGSLRTNIGIACWEQPADQTLAPFDSNIQLTVEKLPNNNLKVCAQEAPNE